MFLPNFRSVAQTVKRFNRESADRRTHTDGTDSIPSTADAGGKKTLEQLERLQCLLAGALTTSVKGFTNSELHYFVHYSAMNAYTMANYMHN